ncbi:Uncharacterised protein [[Clostridium] sordellii]|uniref:hypothetical protein n=1 Tax=Paraclostridium sordellii TaxID=1505 RepID=UPI0005E63F44|nr:hypothetical protein [Paeniclostridium sordellii]MCR1850885.1 hypothetical protein [Paeniclostridium sordellii]CEN23242.1 Uncharacterised protein [[Clostridium] sordellii] [Paeniclostridium sordellii]
MSILTILTAIYFFNRSKKLKETKDIEKYVWECPKEIKDRDGYIKLYSKLYFSRGLLLITFEVFNRLNNYYFKLSVNILSILFFIFFALILRQSFVVEEKSKKFIY